MQLLKHTGRVGGKHRHGATFSVTEIAVSPSVCLFLCTFTFKFYSLHHKWLLFTAAAVKLKLVVIARRYLSFVEQVLKFCD